MNTPQDLLTNVSETGNILTKQIQESNTPTTKRLNEYSGQQSDLILEMKKHKGNFDSAAKPGYNQLNFPYNSEYINKIDVGKIKTMPVGGIDIQGKHTNDSCAMNAALVYNQKNTPSSGVSYEKDMQYKFVVGPMSMPTMGPTSMPTAGPTSMPTAGPTSMPTAEPTSMPTAGTAGPTSMPTMGPITKTGMYSKILPFPVDDAPIKYPLDIELSGLLLPEGGGNKGKITLDAKGKTIGVWLGIKSNMCTKNNAFAYYENGVAKETINSKTPFLVLKNTFMPVIIKYTARAESDVILPIDLDGNFKPFKLTTDSGNKTINYSIFVNPESSSFGSPIYYNFQKETGKCTVYDTRNKDIDANLLENSENYGKYKVEMVLSIPLNDLVEFVGLNEAGELTQYYLDPTLKSQPVKDPKGAAIAAKNRGKGGKNRNSKYTMVLHDAVGKIKNTSSRFTFPIEGLNRSDLVTNTEWKKVDKYYLESIDNSGQTNERGLPTPSMQITKTLPLFSKDYKLKMTIELEGGFRNLKIYKTVRNTNSLVSVIPDFKMGRLFIADENMGVTTLHLVGKNNTKKQGWYEYKGYGPKKDSYTVSDKKFNGDCANKASAKSHYFFEKGKCYIPATEQSISGYTFVPNKDATLFVPTQRVTSGDIKKDVDLKLKTYKYFEDAYSKKEYTNFNLAKPEWNTELSLSKQDNIYNRTHNYSRTSLGLNSKDTTKDIAAIMPKEGFVERTLQDRTIDQITNGIEPRFYGYLEKQSQINKNAADIDRVKNRINAKYGVMSATDTETSGVKTNVFYDFTDAEVYSLQEDRSLVPALLKDQQTMIVEHNKLFVISTITVATLLISAIFVSSN